MKEPRIIKITNEKGEIKGIQRYEYNEKGDPTLFTKEDKDGKKLVDWKYEYEYNQDGTKRRMEIKDLQTGRSTIMEYEY